MSEQYFFVSQAEAFLYDKDLVSRIDQVLYGWAIQVIGELGDFYQVETAYGYTGYISKAAVIPTELARIAERDSAGWDQVVIKRFQDVLSLPKVQGRILITLGRGCVVEALDEEENGYRKVRLLDGQTGYMPASSLLPRRDSNRYFYSEDRDSFFLKQGIGMPEADFRKLLVEHVKRYEGTQYCWSGKSGHGTDCSGLVGMAYMLSGVLIYRDAKMPQRWPMRNIPLEEIQPGDAIYFPGHVAMYIGDGKYVHSTGHMPEFGYAVNSLRPEDEDYREDLAHKIIGVGSIFSVRE